MKLDVDVDWTRPVSAPTPKGRTGIGSEPRGLAGLVNVYGGSTFEGLSTMARAGPLDVFASATASPVTTPTNSAATNQPVARCPRMLVTRFGLPAAG